MKCYDSPVMDIQKDISDILMTSEMSADMKGLYDGYYNDDGDRVEYE